MVALTSSVRLIRPNVSPDPAFVTIRKVKYILFEADLILG
jgi:hypothetical protein